MNPSDRVTIGFVNYNKGDMVENCIESVLSQKGGPYRLIFVDNASTDGSRELVADKFADKLEIIKLEKNEGPNPARNTILETTQTEFVMFLDADSILEEETVLKLIDALDNHPDAGIASPKIMDFETKSDIQFIGTLIHYIGAAIHLENNRNDTFTVTSLGGACLLTRKEAANLVGGWDEDFFFGWTDGDFVYRLVLAGYKALCVGESVIYHPAKERGISKAFFQIRNRWYFILKTYSWKTLIMIFPVIIIYELFLFGFMFFKNGTFTYFRAIFAVIGRFPMIMRKRSTVQQSRKLSDIQLLTTGDFTVRSDLIDRSWMSGLISLFNKGINLYWQIIRRIYSLLLPILGHYIFF